MPKSGLPALQGSMCANLSRISARGMASTPISLDEEWVSKAYNKVGPGEFIVDIGSSTGTWALDMCKRDPDINVLGLEIKGFHVESSLQIKAESKVNNVHYLACNVHLDITTILNSLQSNNISVSALTIQFPDPHYGNRHLKKRVINAAMLSTFAKYLEPGSTIYWQTDIRDLAQNMVEHLAASEYFTPAEGYSPHALHRNEPAYTMQTDREKLSLREGLPIYRMLYTRNTKVVV